jgi:transcriptional regulator with XRE-family HTH domain
MSRSLPSRHTPRNVRPRVGETNRAERIRQLKKAHPEITWSYIANYVGVEVRSAQEWRRTGGISPKNAEKLAELFGVSYDYLWFGEERGATPDILAGVSKVEQVEDVRAQFLKLVEQHNSKLDRQNRTLERMERNQARIMRALEVRAPESDAPPIVPYPEAEPPPGTDRRAGRADRRASETPRRTGSEG